MPRPKTDIEPRIVDAASERFLREGVDGASLRRIARDAGTSIGMIYYYFPTKDDLFFAVVEDVYVELLKDFEAALAPDSAVERRVQRLYERIAALSAKEVRVIRLVVREVLISSTRLERLIQRFQRGHVPLVLRALQDGFVDGTFSKDRSPVVVVLALFVLGAPAQLLARVVGERAPFLLGSDAPALSSEFVDVLLRGVGGQQRH